MAKQNLDELIEESEKAVEKGEDLAVIEAEHHHKVKEKGKSEKEKVEEKVKEAKQKKEKKQVKDIEDVKDLEERGEVKEEKAEKKIAKKGKQGKAKVRSKKYQDAVAQIDRNKKYELAEAIELVKKTSYTSFDGNVEVHVRLSAASGQVRGLLQYPHPTGKKINVAVLDDKTIKEIEKSSKAPADIYLTTPTMMPKVAKLAKILGPKGKMPNPKAGTIVEDVTAAKKELSGGKVEYKTDSYGNIHQVIGKVSANNKILEENFQALLAVLPIEKIVSVTLCATMGPGIKVQI